MPAAEVWSHVLPRPTVHTAGASRREAQAFTGLTGVQVFQLAVGLVTAPLVARALGAEGRGLLAAVAVPLAVAPTILQLGRGGFAINRAAQGMRPSVLFGSLAIPSVVVGGLVASLSPMIADLLSKGREPVDEFLTIGLALTPIALLIHLAMNIALGLSEWRVLVSARLLVATVAQAGFGALSQALPAARRPGVRSIGEIVRWPSPSLG